MALTDNDRIQEIFLVVGDKLAQVSRRWWYALAIAIIAVIPAFYLFKLGFTSLLMEDYRQPQIVYSAAVKEPLQLIDRKILQLPNNTYAGYFKLKNINLEWGAANQQYSVEFRTLGGTSVHESSGTIFVLPSSEKLVVLPRFSSSQKPEELRVNLEQTQFIQKPNIDVDLQSERVTFQNNPEGLVVTAGVKNLMPFTVKRVDLPVAIYNAANQIVAVNYTYINDLLAGETRTFQYTWPAKIEGAVRAELQIELNIFDRNIFSNPGGVSPFENQ